MPKLFDGNIREEREITVNTRISRILLPCCRQKTSDSSSSGIFVFVSPPFPRRGRNIHYPRAVALLFQILVVPHY